MGAWIAQALYVAAKLGVADVLKDGPRSCEAIARAVGAQPKALRRILRSLAGVGVFAETATGEFQHTPMSEALRDDVPGSVRAWTMFNGEPWHWQLWGALLHGVTSEEVPFDHVFGMRPFEFFPRNPESAAVFDRAMNGFNAPEGPAIVAAYDFSRCKKIADLGGGNGALLLEVLRANPQASGVLLEVPHVIERAKAHVARDPAAQRLELMPGSVFERVPPGCDVYLMKHVIHDFNDADALEILRSCRRGMPPDARLVIVEVVLPDGNEPSLARFLDLEMLLIGGIERSVSDFRTLLAEAGFSLVNVIPTRVPAALIEARPV